MRAADPQDLGDNALAGAPRRGAAERRLELLFYAVGVLLFRAAIMDDTFIHLQYARNLRAHGELAFNAGQPSLGATSPLWMLLLAATGVGPTGARVLSVAFGALAVLVFAALARRTLGRASWALGATCAWAGSLWLVRHAPNGMETTLAVLVLLGSVELRARGGRHAGRDTLVGLALAAAILTRPEVALLALLFAIQDLATPWGRGRLAVWLPTCVVPCLAWAMFAHGQTGHWLPETGPAKSGGFALAPLVWLRVLWREVRILGAGHAVEMLGILIAFAWSLRLDGRAVFGRVVRHPLAPYAGFAGLLCVAYAVADVQVQPRYLLLVTPALVLVGFAAWGAVLGSGSRTVALVCAASLAVGAVTGIRSVYPATRDFALGVERVLRPMALDIARRGIPNAVVATPDIGVVGYYSGARILDLGGLIDPRVQALVDAKGYEAMMEEGLFLDLERVEFVIDRSLERERFRDHATRRLHWRVLRTGVVRGLGVSRPGNYYYTLYVLEPPSALGLELRPRAANQAFEARHAAARGRRLLPNHDQLLGRRVVRGS